MQVEHRFVRFILFIRILIKLNLILIYMGVDYECIKQLLEKYKGKNIGFTCSCFDILHAGHIIMLKDAKKQCDILIVGLQTDPTIDRKEKNKPIQLYEERYIMASAVKHIDDIIKYSTEKELYELLSILKPDIRILGSDHKNKPFTGDDLDIKIYWHDRNHNYSTSNLRKRIYLAEHNKTF